MKVSRRSAMGLAFSALAFPALSPEANTLVKESTMPRSFVSALKLGLFKCRGDEALAEWERLRSGRDGWPILVGDDRALTRLVEAVDAFLPWQTVEQILARADLLHFPDELHAADQAIRCGLIEDAKRALALSDEKLPRAFDFDEDGEVLQLSVEETRRKLAADIASGFQLPVGAWPTSHHSPLMPPAIFEGTQLRENVNILLVPVTGGPEVFAYLRWAGVNMCPPSEVHVAALRLWHERYGAQLVALTEDSITLRVERKPQTREAALALSREHLLYCTQSVETIAPVAAGLMTSDWWYFWWD